MNPDVAFQSAIENLKAEKLQDAIHLLLQSLKDQSNNVSVLHLLGIAYYQLKNYDAAIEYSKKALQLNPANADVLYNLGNAYRESKEFEEAIAYYREALEINPGFGDVYYNLGTIFQDENRLDEAISCYQEALQINPNDIDAYYNLGNVFRDKGQFEEAIACYKKALDLNPNLADAYNNLGTALLEMGNIDEAEQYYKRAIDSEPQNFILHQNIISSMLYNVRYDSKTIYSEHLHFAKCFGDPLSSFISLHTNAKKRDRRLKIGYVSPDFRRHSVAYFIEPVLSAHNRDTVEIVCYSDVKVPDNVTRRIQGYADQWRTLASMSDEKVAEMIRQDGIDILVDLSGHTASNRMLLFARKPAPVQVSWIGYPATTGLSTMDYKIVDPYTDPPGMTEQFYTEKLIRMPESFLCYLPDPDSPEVGSLPSRSTGHITFGSFNNFSKANTIVIKLWAAILKKIPGARLLMKAKAFSDKLTCEYAADLFRQRGIGADRIKLLFWEPTTKAHLLTYNHIDIALDTFPYNGTTTTCEALWMGVPVLTLAGDALASRVGVSLLSNVGLKEIIAQTPEEYIEIAVSLAKDIQRLKYFRENLRDMMAQSPLTNTKQFTLYLENCYRGMWEAWCKSR